MPESDQPTDLTGRTLGDFQVLRKLGQGGMAQVYLARQLSLKREVALKLLRKDLAADPTALARFQAEAEAVARISHPNIVQVYAVGEHDGLRFIALEYVSGRNLRDFLATKGPPDLTLALAIIRQVAAALQRASEAGIVHRDVKPENILLTRKAEVKVADFGLSRLVAQEQPLNLTQSGVTLGTPLYMAPEQVQGQPIDHRTDIYSLGVTCYHLLAGQPPFGGATAFEVAMKHVGEPPPPLAAVRPDLPADLCAMLHKMMAKDPADRYQTAKEILRDLAKVREGLPLAVVSGQWAVGNEKTGASPTSAATAHYSLPVGHSPWPARALGVLALAGLAIGGWWTYAMTHPAPVATATAAGPGLPDARPPEKVVSSRERELLKKKNERGAKPTEVAEALIDLGLLYVRERRLDEAEQAFKDLGEERFDPARPRPGFLPYQTAARFGRGIVLAHRDRVTESVQAFQVALPAQPKAATAAMASLRAFLADHPDLAQAVSEALHRNAENLRVEGKKLPPVLELLRLQAGPKG